MTITPSYQSFCAAFALIGLNLLCATANAQIGDLQAELVTDSLQFPVKMAPISERDLLVNEKFGALRLIRDGKLVDKPLWTFEVKGQNEAGLLDVVLTPDFEETGEFLVSYTPQEDLDALYITRLKLEGDKAQLLADPWLRLPSRAAADRHFSGTMAFDSKGRLFVTLGDLRQAQNSQDPDKLPGSVLRFKADGTPAKDNPFGEDNPVWAYGARNFFGIFIDNEDNVLTVENGDDVADELNFVEEGKNYGWPHIHGYCDGYPYFEPCSPDFADPIYDFRTVIGPTAVVRYTGGIEAFEGDIFVTGWHSARVDHFSWEGPGARAKKRGVLYKAQTQGAGITDLKILDDGSFLVLESSNQGGAIYRLARPAQVWDEEALIKEEESQGCAQTGTSQGSLSSMIALFLGLLALRAPRRF